MPKFSTKSRIELAQLKRQLETRRKQFRAAHDEALALPTPREEKQTSNNEKPQEHQQQQQQQQQDSHVDYKFVFTNSAMKIEDKVFRVKNPAVALERDMKVIKPMAATTSFLPYGVTIRNPHMFEEDQLAVIQRRQEVHNISASPAPYNPFVSHDSTKSLASSTTLSPRMSYNSSRLHEGIPTIPNRYSVSRSLRNSDGKMSSLARKPLLNYRSFMADRFTSTINSKLSPHHNHDGSAPTTSRDNEFREKFNAVEAQRSKGYGNDDAHAYHLRREQSQQNNKVIDKLSSTVQQLNKYEERLKHYLKSKNTMVHAGAALKQLRFKRSKTIAQLSKLTLKETPDKNRSPRFLSRDENKRISFAQETAAATTKRKNQNSPRNTPKHSRNPSPTPRDRYNNNANKKETGKNSFRSSQLEGKKLSTVIGNKLQSMQQHGRTPSARSEDDRMTPLQAAMIEGIELEKLSSVLTHTGHDTKKHDFTQVPPTIAPGPTPRTGVLVPDDLKARLEGSTVSLFRYKQNDQPYKQQPVPAAYDGRDLLDVPKYTTAYDNHARLFATAEAPSANNGMPQPTLESKRSSEVIRRAYQEFQVHQDKVQVELLRDSSRRTKKSLQASNKGMAELSAMMKEKAYSSQRQPQRVPH